MAAILPAWIKKYGEQEALKMWEDYKHRIKGNTKEKLREKHGDEYVKDLSKRKVSYSLDSYIKRYGKELGERKWNETLNKKLKTQKENFKNKKWNNGRTLEQYQTRYGVEDGYNKWQKRNKHQSYMVSLERYLVDFGEEGRDIIKRMKNTTSLEKFIERYGKEDGPLEYKKYTERCKLSSKRSLDYWIHYHNGDLELAKQSRKEHQSNTSLDKFVERYGEIIGREKYINWIENVTSCHQWYSKVSQELFWRLFEDLNLLEHETRFYELNSEEQFYLNDKVIRVDFKYKNKIIEFNGDYWHANPELYSKSDKLVKGKTAESIWAKDASRIDRLTSAGYEIMVVWENEWKNNRDYILNECKNFIKKENE